MCIAYVKRWNIRRRGEKTIKSDMWIVMHLIKPHLGSRLGSSSFVWADISHSFPHGAGLGSSHSFVMPSNQKIWIAWRDKTMQKVIPNVNNYSVPISWTRILTCVPICLCIVYTYYLACVPLTFFVFSYNWFNDGRQWVYLYWLLLLLFPLRSFRLLLILVFFAKMEKWAIYLKLTVKWHWVVNILILFRVGILCPLHCKKKKRKERQKCMESGSNTVKIVLLHKRTKRKNNERGTKPEYINGFKISFSTILLIHHHHASLLFASNSSITSAQCREKE